MDFVDKKLDVAEDITRNALSNAATKTVQTVKVIDQKLDYIEDAIGDALTDKDEKMF